MGAGAGKNTTSTVNQTTSNIPAYAQPYYMGMMNQAQALTDTTKNPYTPYGGERLAGYTPEQTQVQRNILGQQVPGQFQAGSQLATTAGLGALQAGQYNPSQFGSQQVGQPNLQQYSMQQPGNVQGGSQNAPDMQGAQTGYQPNLNYFQMQGPGSFGSTQAQQYMSPYMQNVVDVQKQQAIRDAQQGQLSANLGAVRQGTYGGARQLLAGTERERNLGNQLGQLQATGLQNAYQSAQAQFNTEQAAQQQAAQQNLSAMLGVQGLGAQYGTQLALSNLSNEQQANVQNLAAQLQQQGLNQQQAMQAALANQQAGLTTGQQNLNAALQTQQLGTQTGMQALLANQQSDLEAQRLAEQSGQFGATLGLQGLQQANQSAQTLGNLGGAQQQAQQAMYGQQQATAAQTQALQQQLYDQQYQDFLRQQQYPMEQLRQYSGLLQGVPTGTNQTQTISAPGPSLGAQLMGTGLTALSAYNMAK
jgi:hypothetical protein